MTVTAHSGAYGTPDNSVENVKRVLEEKCTVFEIDVSFRPDGTPVIIHNQAPAEDEGVLLEEVLEIAGSSSDPQINLDIKSTANLPAVDSLLEKYGLMKRAFYTGVFRDWVECVRTTSAVPYYLNASLDEDKREDRQTIAELAAETKASGAIGLNTHYSNVTSMLIEIFHEEGLKVSVWTVDERETAMKFVAMCPDNITSRHPDMICSVINSK